MKGWIDFWSGETTNFDAFMEISTSYFCSQLEREIPFHEKSSILDIGCGPGHLVHHFHHRVDHVTGLDVSARFVDACRQRFQTSRNCDFSLLDSRSYTTFPQLKREYTHIIFLSVLQYYSTRSEVEEALSGARALLAPGGVIVLADLLFDSVNPMYDAVTFLGRSLRQGVGSAALRFLWRLRRSEYARVRRDNRLLFLDRSGLKGAIERLGYQVRQVSDSLTFNPARSTWILSRSV